MSKEGIDSSLQIADLISNYIESRATEWEIRAIQQWMEEDPENRIIFDKICNEENLNTVNTASKIYNSDLALLKVKSVLGIDRPPASIWKKKWWFIDVAAVIALVFFAFYFSKVSHQLDKKPTHDDLSNKTIKPGKNTALLTLANGKKIDLSGSKTGIMIDASQVRYTDGSLISDLDRTRSLTISTPRGGTYQVRLADGTNVWLNAASSLTYAARLTANGERKVRVQGEAYLEVAKDKKHPFVVESSGQQVTVLGTCFNINSYADEQYTKTTLIEGSLKVNDITLRPNQQSTLSNRTNRLEVKEVNASLAIAWKDGKFSCKNENLESLLRRISRWYDVDFEYENQTVRQQTFSGTLNRADEFKKVLERIALTGEVNFRIEGPKVIVTK